MSQCPARLSPAQSMEPGIGTDPRHLSKPLSLLYSLMLTSEGVQDPGLLLHVPCGFESLKEGTVYCECFILPSARRKLVWENSQRSTSTTSFYEGRIKVLFIICKAYISEYYSLIVS